jgi:acetoin utilization deacetylase AcuC-like enzyme
MHAYASDKYVLPLPPGHRFPMSKYRLLRARVEAEVPRVKVIEAPMASEAELERVHTRAYVQRVLQGGLSAAEQREIGFPWSEQMVERSRRSAGATIAAAREALASQSIAANLAGGTHHAYADKGSGFCVFNDTAAAIRALQTEGALEAPRVFLRGMIQSSRSRCTVRKTFPFAKKPARWMLPCPMARATRLICMR